MDGDLLTRRDLAGGDNSDVVAQALATKCRVNRDECVAQRQSDVVDEREGAAPDPPSWPSTAMKSGPSPCLRMSRQSSLPSAVDPTTIFRPIGLTVSLRTRATNSSSDGASWNSSKRFGEWQSSPIGIPRIAAIAAVKFSSATLRLCLALRPARA